MGPSWASAQDDLRPLVHVSPLAGMLAAARPPSACYVVCLRNLKATAAVLATRHQRVAILCAGEAGEVCAADEMAAAWLAAGLAELGFRFEDRSTETEVARWGHSDASLIAWSRSADRLRKRGRGHDVDFVLTHVDDLDLACGHHYGEVRAIRRQRPDTAAAVEWATPAMAAGPH